MTTQENEWPRLSETLSGRRNPITCQACGMTSVRALTRWQEHDAEDQPEPIVVVLCEACETRLIEPHPRLYRRLERHEPFPGSMGICWSCGQRDGVRCRSPLLKSNGGPGVRFPKPDMVIFVDGTKNRRRFSQRLKGWSNEAAECPGRTERVGAGEQARS